MADTIRTRAALVTLLADNTAGAISEQDMRDFLATVDGANGSLYLSATGASASITPGTPVILGGTTTLGEANNVTMPSNWRLTSGAGATLTYEVRASVSVTTSSSNQVLTFSLYKNGAKVTGSDMKRKVGTGSDVGNASVSWVISLADTDYIEVFVDSDSVTTVTSETGVFSMFSLVS